VIAPWRSDQDFLADVAAAAAHPDRLCLWWLGQSGFLLQWNGRRILLDPYLSDSLTEKYAGSERPHVRMTARVVAPAALPPVDLVSCSHEHTDHLDGETLRPVLAANPEARVVVPAAISDLAASRLGVPATRLLPLDAGEEAEWAGVVVHAVASAHETVERDARGRCRFLGYVLRAGPWTLYHSGDTVRYPGLAEGLRTFPLDVAILPINGRRPERGVPGNLDGAEAAALARDAGARLVIPCHYEMFTFNTASPDLFRREAERLGQRYRILRAGERCCLPEGGDPPRGSSPTMSPRRTI
jgi:L-ascorbate metabolism protein UlaG (beta-lactamase superfamily)